MAFISGGHRSAAAFTDAFKTGFAIGQTKKKERKEDALSEAYATLSDIGGEVEYDTDAESAEGVKATAIPVAPQQVQMLREQEGAIPTEQQQQLAQQAGDFDVPKKISLTDHMANRKKARDIMAKAGVSGKDMIQFDADYDAQLNKSARKYRDMAANAWATGNFDAAARYVESAYQYINDGSDVQAQFIPGDDGKMRLAMGFTDSVTGETSQEKPMLIDSPEKFAVMSEKAIDYGAGLGLQKDQLALKLQEDANSRAEGKYEWWDITKDEDRELDNLFKLAGVENNIFASRAKLLSSFSSEKVGKAVLASEKNLLSEIDRRYNGGDEDIADPTIRQDVSATASALNRMVDGKLSASELIETSKYATTVTNEVDRLVQEQIENDPANEQLTAGALRTKKSDFKKQILVNEGFLRFGKDGGMEMRTSATGDNWMPAPPRLYNGTPIVTQHSLDTALMGKLSTSGGDTATINRIREILKLPDYIGGGSSSASVSAKTSRTPAPKAAPARTPKPTPAAAKPSDSGIKDPGAIVLPPINPKQEALPTAPKKQGIKSPGTKSRTKTKALEGRQARGRAKQVVNSVTKKIARGKDPSYNEALYIVNSPESMEQLTPLQQRAVKRVYDQGK